MEDTFISQALDWAKKRGFSNLKARHEDYESPRQFVKADADEEAYVPDITGLRTGGKSYIEVALKTDEIQRKVSKWKLLSILAARKGGKLFLLAPRGHKTFAENIVKAHNLTAEVRSL